MLTDFQKRINKLDEQHLIRERFIVDPYKNYLHFASNDYLNLANHPLVKEASIAAIEKYGLGSGSSALVSGYHHAHQSLEEAFAEFLGQEQAILFNSGYHANVGLFAALTDRHTTIIADKHCHASLLDGIQLSRAKHDRFLHQDMTHVDALLKKAKSSRLLVTESVFSMSGEISPAKKLASLAKQYDAALVIDDAHGIGVLGKQGKGIAEHAGLTANDITCLITPLGKAMGSMGAIVSGKKSVIDTLIQFARTYRYTTALPPAIASGTLAALKVMQEETWRIEKLQALIHFFIAETKKRGLPLMADDATPIKAILIEDNVLVKKIQSSLQTQGMLVSAIRPPTVPTGTTRLRISLQCSHQTSDILRLLEAIEKAYES